MSEPLKYACPRLLQCRGSAYEGDVFAILRLSPYIIRAFEFALADGAIDCSKWLDPKLSYAERFWDLYQRRYSEPSTLLLFEVKSTVGTKAGEQHYITNVSQRRHVAFFICVNAIDPTFVDLIPNWQQHDEALEEEGTKYTRDIAGRQQVAVNASRRSTLPESAYGGLDQCMSPYRLPLALLPEAIARIRRHALGGPAYINPWTGVEFSEWQPKTTSQNQFIRPGDDTAQASAYEAVMEIFRIVHHSEKSAFDMDFIGVQPSLADFKLISKSYRRPIYVQHKIDATIKAKDSPLRRVTIARKDGFDGQFYFSTFDRFEYVWYQFVFSKNPPEVEQVVYFIPESQLPDEVFTTHEKEIDFERFPHLKQFRFVMDDDGAWLDKMQDNVRQYPYPRKSGERPLRQLSESQPGTPTPSSASKIQPDTRSAKPPEIAPSALTRKIPKSPSGPNQGRRLFAEMMVKGQRRFFYSLMKQCAIRSSCLLVVLSGGHPLKDFGFCHYSWSPEERREFFTRARPPRFLHHLPPDAEMLPVSYFTQDAESNFFGPNIRPNRFRRLNASVEPGVIIWDLAGPDGTMRPAIIPTDDIRPTEKQRGVFERNLAMDKNKGDRDAASPNLSAVFSTGLFAAEYGCGTGGPEAYESDSWSSIWDMLYRFISLDDFEHPRGHVRNPAHYRFPVRTFNQRLMEQHFHDQQHSGSLQHEDEEEFD